MPRMLLILATGITITGLALAQAPSPFSTFTFKTNYSLGRAPLSDLNEDINQVDDWYRSGEWVFDYMMFQGGEDVQNEFGRFFEYPVMIDTHNFINLPEVTFKLETNISLLWHLGGEFSLGSNTKRGLQQYSPGGTQPGSIKRKEKVSVKKAMLFGNFRIRDRKLPLYLYTGAGAGLGLLQADGYFRSTDSGNSARMETEREVFTTSHSASAPYFKGFLGLEYQVFGNSLIFAEFGYEHLDFSSLDGTTTYDYKALADLHNLDDDLTNDVYSHVEYEGERPSTYDFIWNEDAWSSGNSYEGDYIGDFINYNLSGIYFQTGIAIQF